jgi:hypothetical protein
MKKIKLSKSAGKLIFFICCIILAFAFWFVVKYSHLAALPLALAEFC